MKPTVSLRPWVLLLLSILLLSGCGAPPLRDAYSQLQLREVRVLPGGLRLDLRLSNFGDKEIEVEGLSYALQIDGRPAIQETHEFELRLPPYGVEPLSFEVSGVALHEPGRAPDRLHYVLTGTVQRRGFGGTMPFRHEGQLSPVPGLAGAWR